MLSLAGQVEPAFEMDAISIAAVHATRQSLGACPPSAGPSQHDSQHHHQLTLQQQQQQHQQQHQQQQQQPLRGSQAAAGLPLTPMTPIPPTAVSGRGASESGAPPGQPGAPKDLLLLQRDGRLTLHVGRQPLCDVLVRPPPLAMGSDPFSLLLGSKRRGVP